MSKASWSVGVMTLRICAANNHFLLEFLSYSVGLLLSPSRTRSLSLSFSLLLHRSLDAKLPSSDLNFAMDVGVEDLLLVFPR